MSRFCFGPDVRGSAVVERWYFEDSELYEFVERKIESETGEL